MTFSSNCNSCRTTSRRRSWATPASLGRSIFARASSRSTTSAIGSLHLAFYVFPSVGDAIERIFLGLVAPDILLEVGKFRLNAFLFLCHGSICRTILRQGLAQHIVGLVNLALILVSHEVIVHAHRRRIVQITRHNLLLGKIRRQVIILYPEERILGATIAEVVVACHDRTKCQHLGKLSP